MQVVTQWTAAAQRYAQQHGIDTTSLLLLSADAQTDDYVELPGPQGALTFIVRRRTWRLATDGSTQLCIEIDHPPRPSGL